MRLKIFFAYLKYTCRNVRYNLNSFCLQSVTLYLSLIHILLKSEIDPVVEYTDHLADTIKGDLSGLRVAVDCANGSSSTTVERLMRLVECKAEILSLIHISDAPALM